METIKTMKTDNNIEPSVEKVLTILKKKLEKFKKLNKASKTQQFKLAPKIMMNLLLNFESFDPQTMVKDVYMPEEKIVNFNVGYLKINFKGKLRLSHDKDTSYDNPPAKTYGIIEERGILTIKSLDLYMKFDKPVIIKYLYLRPHKVSNVHRQYTIEISGYKNEQMVFSMRENAFLAPRQWVFNQLRSIRSLLPRRWSMR
jgi:hypothetical protein